MFCPRLPCVSFLLYGGETRTQRGDFLDQQGLGERDGKRVVSRPFDKATYCAFQRRVYRDDDGGSGNELRNLIAVPVDREANMTDGGSGGASPNGSLFAKQTPGAKTVGFMLTHLSCLLGGGTLGGMTFTADVAGTSRATGIGNVGLRCPLGTLGGGNKHERCVGGEVQRMLWLSGLRDAKASQSGN